MIRNAIISLALIISGAIGATLLFSPNAHAATQCDRDGMILTLKPWYYGLTNSDCTVKSPSDLNTGSENDGMQKFVTRIILTVVEDLLHIVAYVTVIFIIYGGFIYITSSGMPERAITGRKTVVGAVVGLFIAIASAALINLIGGALGI